MDHACVAMIPARMHAHASVGMAPDPKALT